MVMTPEDRALAIASNWEIYGVAQQRLADQIAQAIKDAVEEALRARMAWVRELVKEDITAEREACAKVADNLLNLCFDDHDTYVGEGYKEACAAIAQAIRNRK